MKNLFFLLFLGVLLIGCETLNTVSNDRNMKPDYYISDLKVTQECDILFKMNYEVNIDFDKLVEDAQTREEDSEKILVLIENLKNQWLRHAKLLENQNKLVEQCNASINEKFNKVLERNNYYCKQLNMEYDQSIDRCQEHTKNEEKKE